MAREIKTFKLTNGEEIVAYATKTFQGIKDEYTVEKAHVHRIMQTREGPQAGLIPWVLTSPDCEFKLNENHYFLAVTPTKEVEDYFLELTSGIALNSRLN